MKLRWAYFLKKNVLCNFFFSQCIDKKNFLSKTQFVYKLATFPLVLIIFFITINSIRLEIQFTNPINILTNHKNKKKEHFISMSPNTYLTPTIPHSDLSSIKVDQMYPNHPMRHSIMRFNRSSTSTPKSNNNNNSDFVSILSPPISPSGKKIQKHALSVSSAPITRVSTPSPYTTDSQSSSNTTTSNSSSNTTENSVKLDLKASRFPHHFPPMKSIDPPVYKPAPGTTENKFRELVEEKRLLERGPAQAPFADYNTDNFADSKSSSSLPMTSCAWDRCRSKNYLSAESANLDNYKRGIQIHDPYSLAIHSLNNKTKAQSMPNSPKRSSRARLAAAATTNSSASSGYECEGAITRSALSPKPSRVEKPVTTCNTPTRTSPHAGLATLGAAVLAITKQQENSTLPPIRYIHHGSSSLTTLPSISTLSSVASSPMPHSPSSSSFSPSCDYYSNVSTPIQSPRLGYSSLSNNTPSTSSNLRFVNSLSSSASTPAASNTSTPNKQEKKKSSRKPTMPRKRTPPVLSRVHDMNPEEVPDYSISAGSLLPGKVLRAEWKGTPMDLSKDPNFHKLHPAEVNLAATLRLSVDLYLDSKKRLFAEKVHRFKQGLPFRRTDSQKACRIDVNKASRLFMAYEKVGWLDDANFEKYKNEPLSVTSRL